MFEMEKVIADFTAIARELGEKAYNDGYNKGLVKAWACARDILTMSQEEFDGIFDEMDRWEAIEKHIPTECINAIKEYREKKANEEIQVGDEIYRINENYTFVVTAVVNDKVVIMSQFGKWDTSYKSEVHKTGKSFPQLADMLNRMRGGE